MRPGREANYPFPSSAEFENEWSHTSIPPSLHVVGKQNFGLYLVTECQNIEYFHLPISPLVRFEGSATVVVHVVLYGLVGEYQYFGETYCFRLQGVQGTAVCSSFRGSFWLCVQGTAIARR